MASGSLSAYLKMLLFHTLAVLLLVFMKHVDSSEIAVSNMVHHITQSYLSGSRCIVMVTEKKQPLNEVVVPETPTLRIIVGVKMGDVFLYVEDNNTNDTYTLGKGAQEFELLLTKNFDARCLGFFVQIQNSSSVTYSFGRAMARTLQRVLRYYVFFPSVDTEDMDKFAEDILRKRDLELMPNILIMKTHSNSAVSLEIVRSVRNLFCSDTSLQVQGSNSDTDEMLHQGMAFAKNLSIGFKDHKNKQVTHTSYPKLASINDYYTSNILAMEIVTQSFVGFNPSEEVFLDVWIQFKSEGFFIHCANLFLDKILDLQGKPITAIAVPYDPFAVMHFDDDPPVFDGIEFLIFKELLYKFNGSLRVIYDPGNYWGAIFPNGTGNGIVGHVLSGAADIGFSAMYMDWSYEWLWTDFSYPYGQSAAVLVAPRPKLLPGFYIPLLPFSSGMWAAVFLSVVGISFCTWCLSLALHRLLPGLTKSKYSFGSTYLDMLAMLVLQVPNEAREEWNYSPWKHYMTWILIYFLLITSVYSGGLASILTVPRYEAPLDTLVQLAESSVGWAFTHDSCTWAYRYSDDPVLITVKSKFRRRTEEELAVIAMKGDTGIFIEMLTGGAFGTGPYITTEVMGKLRLMREPLYNSHVVLVLRKDGPYVQPLNDIILIINQAGLGIYWQADVVRRFLSSRLQLLITLSRTELNSDGDTPRTLSLSHVEGPFILLAIGLGISAIAFLAEIAVYRYQKKAHH